MRPKALVVEDEKHTQRLLTEIMQTEGFDVDVAGDGDVAIAQLSAADYAVVLLDIVLPTVSGTTVMEHLHATNPQVLERIIVVTGLDVAEIRELFPTVRLALSKPVLPGRLRESVRNCISGSGPAVA
ncbi:MAG TPA: response regulator [Thermoanaerobaculia bacterium]|nr:response regulator [Thermoanaerobaculia bacterium]